MQKNDTRLMLIPTGWRSLSYEIMSADVKLTTLLTLTRDVKNHTLLISEENSIRKRKANHAVSCCVARANTEVSHIQSQLLLVTVRGGGVERGSFSSLLPSSSGCVMLLK